MKKKQSIHDIARELNISATTISFVLNGKAEEKRISKEVEKMITDHVQATGYQPNLIAKSLRTGKSKIIGMLVENISDPFFSSISRNVEIMANKHGYKIFYSSTENDTTLTKSLLKAFRESQVDGYIIAPPPGIEAEIKALQDDNFPLILFDRYFPGILTNTVLVDNFQGAYEGVKHLQENGYKTTALVTLSSGQTQMQDRLKGYNKAVEECGIQPMVLTIPYENVQETASAAITEFVKAHSQIDSILFATNYLAISGLRSIKDIGLKVPDDIGIVGFDDNTHFNLFSPSITAVAQPIQEISEEVVNLLMSCLSKSNESLKKRTVVLPTHLHVRNSSRIVDHQLISK